MHTALSYLTLGVADVEASIQFYESLGFELEQRVDDWASFDAGGIHLALYPADDLARDAHAEAGTGSFPGVTLAVNVPEAAQVDSAIEEARDLGAEIAKEPAETDWGGYSGYFRDPDGHYWEVAHSPGFTPE